MRTAIVVILGILFLIFLSRSCSGDKEFKKSPIDELIKELNTEPVFSILLLDMDVEGTFSKTYKHQYQIITEKDSLPQQKNTDWYEVNEDFFNQHIDDMGMEIASKGKDGKVKKDVTPPGYSNYVGNPQYGQWTTGSNGSSFWEFYGKFAMLNTVFNLLSNPINRGFYDDYDRNYRNSGRPYYGPSNSSGHPTYGTHGTSSTHPDSKWNSKSSNQSFKEKIRNRVQRSSSTTSRSTSRFGTSSSRSRSRGGFGK
jgi:hypothetical protein